MSRGKVETISRFARWRAGGLDIIGPWTDSNLEPVWSYCWSDPFKIGVFEWYLGIARHEEKNQKVFMGLRLKSPVSTKQPLVPRFVLHVFDTEHLHSPYISPVYEKEIKPNVDSWHFPMEYTPKGPFVVYFELLDLRTHPLNGAEGLNLMWSSKGLMMQSLATKTTHPCLSRMLQDGIHADVIINTADGGVLKAHKAVLSASSPVFESMFRHSLKEKETSTVDIEDMSSKSCSAMLSYMYGTMKQEEFWEQRLLLMVAADKYDMAYLKECCEESLLEDLCSSNVLERLREACSYQLDKLKKRCFTYLFDFGKVYEVRDEIDSFFLDVDQELKLEMFHEMVKFRKPV